MAVRGFIPGRWDDGCRQSLGLLDGSGVGSVGICYDQGLKKVLSESLTGAIGQARLVEKSRGMVTLKETTPAFTPDFTVKLRPLVFVVMSFMVASVSWDLPLAMVMPMLTMMWFLLKLLHFL